ncbi:class I SAM-dependent methyltransferase [Selenomonas sp. FC4001]|uniref:class I SAM-dependent methyltransferase n=1 Tax=Selenomonas sp. FC4001 TaxID=1408313 RepID=UPI0005679141|nr:class I SAM-dependent methyltransferase [Selenomonas sp. FC4001]
MDRIKGDAIDIDDQNVKEFFSNRVKKELPYRYNYTNYQDANPELVLMRDKCEKEKIIPLLQLNGKENVLDIGCGVGRWGDYFSGKEGYSYIGADYCKEILDIAEKHFQGNENVSFIHTSFQDLAYMLSAAKVNMYFDLVLINGVLMYINDDDITTCLQGIKELVKPSGRVYVKETVGKESRLTLLNIYSEELLSNYSAIYRSKEEYNELWNVCWPCWNIYDQGALWGEGIQKRSETETYYWLFQK